MTIQVRTNNYLQYLYLYNYITYVVNCIHSYYVSLLVYNNINNNIIYEYNKKIKVQIHKICVGNQTHLLCDYISIN